MDHDWLKSWSKTPRLIALFSAESGLYVSSGAIAEPLGMQPMAADLSLGVRLRTLAAAFVALDVIARRGIGKVRRFDPNHLWIQEVATTKSAKLENANGVKNPADLLTKDLPRADMRKHLGAMGASFVDGRSALAPQLSTCAAARVDGAMG